MAKINQPKIKHSNTIEIVKADGILHGKFTCLSNSSLFIKIENGVIIHAETRNNK